MCGKKLTKKWAKILKFVGFYNGQHLIQECSCHHGTHRMQFDLNQPVNGHIENFDI
jgi:hypothetical protein